MLSQAAGFFVGVEIGGTKLQMVAADNSLHIVRRWRGMVERTRGAGGILEQLEEALRQVSGGAIAGIGVGFGGPIDRRSGKIDRSHQIEGWTGFDLAGWFAKIGGGAAVAVDNDANVGAIGEALCGAGMGRNPVFYVTLGSGVGGGLVVDGRIYHGAPPGEAEFGHVRLDRSGATIENRCCGWAIDARIRDLKKTRPHSALAGMLGDTPGGEARHLAAAVAQHDPAAIAILRELAEDLAFGLSHVTHLFHPEIVVLGGGLSFVGEPLRCAVAEHLPQFIMDSFKPGPAVALAKLGEDAVPMGALQLAKACCGAK